MNGTEPQIPDVYKEMLEVAEIEMLAKELEKELEERKKEEEEMKRDPVAALTKKMSTTTLKAKPSISKKRYKRPTVFEKNMKQKRRMDDLTEQLNQMGV